MHLSKIQIAIVVLVCTFFLGVCTNCTVTTTTNTTCEHRVVIPPEKQAEAAELYAKIYSSATTSGRRSLAERDANEAVLTIYGVVEEKPSRSRKSP